MELSAYGIDLGAALEYLGLKSSVASFETYPTINIHAIVIFIISTLK